MSFFAGSDARKAVNYGEVSLTLDNTSQSLPLDFNEVTVTRRVHRSGDSEYFYQPAVLQIERHYGIVYGYWYRKRSLLHYWTRPD